MTVPDREPANGATPEVGRCPCCGAPASSSHHREGRIGLTTWKYVPEAASAAAPRAPQVPLTGGSTPVGTASDNAPVSVGPSPTAIEAATQAIERLLEGNDYVIRDGTYASQLAEAALAAVDAYYAPSAAMVDAALDVLAPELPMILCDDEAQIAYWRAVVVRQLAAVDALRAGNGPDRAKQWDAFEDFLHEELSLPRFREAQSHLAVLRAGPKGGI